MGEFWARLPRLSTELGAELGAYDPLTARRSAAGILAVFAAIELIGTQAAPVGPVLSVFIGVVLPLLLLGWAGVLLKGRWAWTDSLLVSTPILAIGVIFLLDALTHDASPGGQIAFCAPVLYAASQLRRTAAVLVLVLAIGAEVTNVVMLEPLGRALTDAAYVSVILVVITVLLVSAGRRQNRLLDRLAQLAAVDPLTGLATRRVLDDAADRELSGQDHGTGTALILIDLDHFKIVNDTFGHPVGDDALTHVATAVRCVMGENAVVSRLGGDEFAVLMPRCELPAAVAAAETIVSVVQRTPLSGGTASLPLSVSVGVGFAQRNELSLRELYAAADASLYEAKRSGRGRVGVPSPRRPVTPAAGVPVPDTAGRG